MLKNEKELIKVEESIDKGQSNSKIWTIPVILLLLVIVLATTRFQLDWALFQIWRSGTALPNVAGMMILFGGVFIWNRLVSKGLRLTTAQIVVLYSAVSAAAAFVVRSGGCWSFGFWNNSLAAYQMPTLPWVAEWEKISPLIVPHDAAAMEGMSLGGRSVPWGVWLGPIVTGTLFWAASFLLIICSVNFFRRRWEDEEHVRFPLSIPIMDAIKGTEEGHLISFRNRTTLIALLFAVLYASHMELMETFPWWPQFNIIAVTQNYFSAMSSGGKAPWASVIYYWPGEWRWPQIVGLQFYLSMDILFSGFFGAIIQVLLTQVVGSRGQYQDRKSVV